jgi:hypothetical protein
LRESRVEFEETGSDERSEVEEGFVDRGFFDERTKLLKDGQDLARLFPIHVE